MVVLFYCGVEQRGDGLGMKVEEEKEEEPYLLSLRCNDAHDLRGCTGTYLVEDWCGYGCRCLPPPTISSTTGSTILQTFH